VKFAFIAQAEALAVHEELNARGLRVGRKGVD
jgi:hypothetical protein